jgi:hypothetical protein
LNKKTKGKRLAKIVACVACRLVERAESRHDGIGRPAGRQADRKARPLLLPVSFIFLFFYIIVSLQCGGAVIKRGQTDFEGEKGKLSEEGTGLQEGTG